MKIKKNDTVRMLSGKDRDKAGKIIEVLAGEGKVVVEGLNVIKKHLRPRRQGEQGQRVEIPRRIDASKVMVVCPKCSKPTRVGMRIEGGKKVRICKKCQGEI